MGFIFWGAKCAGRHDLAIAWCLDLASKCALPSECTNFTLPIDKGMSKSREKTKCRNVPGSLHSIFLVNLPLPTHFLGVMLIWQVWQGCGFVEVTYTSTVLIGIPQYSSSLPSSPRAGLNKMLMVKSSLVALKGTLGIHLRANVLDRLILLSGW